MHRDPALIFKYLLGFSSFGIMAYFVTACFRQYFNYPTQTRVSIRLNRFQAFPAVTICSGNPVRFDKFFLPVLNYIQTNNLSSSPPNITNEDIYKGSFNFMVDLFNQNRTDQMLSYGFQLEDILLDCSYNGYNCQRMWTKTISPILGNCYTFNRQTIDRQTPVFHINDVSGQNLALHNGLIITFYLNIELYYPTLQYGLGLTGILHNPDEQPLIRYSGTHFAPGFEHNLVYEKSISTYLGSPYTVCTRQMRDDMKALYSLFDNNTDYIYSETVCIEFCHQTYIYEQCGCIYPTFFYLNHLIINGRLQWVRSCTPWTMEYQCALQAGQYIFNDENLQKSRCSYCQAQCTINKYSNDLSSLKGPSDSEIAYYSALILSNSSIPVKPDFALNSSNYLNRNYLKLSIVPLSPYVTTYEESATYSWSTLVSDLGGQVGLWLGFSVLSLFDLTEYLFKKLNILRLKCKAKITTEVQAFENASVGNSKLT